jgi:ferredoxin
MNTRIYYFSATGNSLVVANDLARELGGAEVIPIAKVLNAGAEELSGTAGIVFPVYMFGLPLIVAKFLKSLKAKEGVYVFSVATFGGLPGRAHSLAEQILKKRGIKLSAGFSVLMPGNYTPLYGAIPKEKQDDMFSKEKLKVKKIAAFIREQKSVHFEQGPFLANFLIYKLLYQIGSSQIPKEAKSYWVTDDCIKCGLCAKVCPVENIQMRDGRPLWLDHCEHCVACLQWCPVEAIQYKKSTLGRKRYHNPDVTAQDIAAQK